MLMFSFHTPYFPLILFFSQDYLLKKYLFNLATPVPSYGTQDLLSLLWREESLVAAHEIYFLNQGSNWAPCIGHVES